VPGLELAGKELVQPQHGSIGDHHVPESVDISVNSVGNSDLVGTVFAEGAEVFREQWRQPVIETARRDCSMSCRVVAASEPGEYSALACGEAEHERPHENGNPEIALSLDHAEFLGVLLEMLRGKHVVSRRMILDEEASYCTLAASSFLSKRSLDKPLLSRGFLS
jgi:hypothetical protein